MPVSAWILEDEEHDEEEDKRVSQRFGESPGYIGGTGVSVYRKTQSSLCHMRDPDI